MIKHFPQDARKQAICVLQRAWVMGEKAIICLRIFLMRASPASFQFSVVSFQ